jgi:hypothetical protein
VPINVQIEDERGHREGESWWHPRSTELLAGEHRGTCCLRFVDPYGDAVFNQAQIPVLLDELRALRGGLRDPGLRSVLDEVLAVVQRAQDRVHTYVRFVGD